MRFIGTFEQTLDPKGRLALPARFRRLLTPEDHDTLVLTLGRERCMLLYPLGEWVQLMERLDAMPRNEAKRDAVRAISADTLELDVDAAGRMTIPRSFLERSGIERDVTIVGSLRYIEVWSRAAFTRARDARRDQSKDILDQLF